ncbi:MAG TPA: alginate export family protein [Kofleriaceae bacterium]|nr:alginate export family protein [Kofleriaceae bacterium]
MWSALAFVVFAAPASAAADTTTITLSGEIRTRGEAYDELDLAEDTETLDQDGQRLLLRTRFGVDASPASGVTVMLQLQDQRIFGQEPSTIADTGNVDLYQGYVQLERLGERPLSLQVGRMELSYGDERLLGAFGWSNTGRAFDAVRARLEPGMRTTVDAFYARLHHDRRSLAPRTLGDDLAGMYLMFVPRGPGKGAMQLDLYGLYLHARGGQVDVDGDGTPDGDRFEGGGRYHLATVGSRFDGEVAAGLRVSAEGAIQAGVAGDLDIFAWAAHASATYTFAALFQPALTLGLDAASGDDDPADGDHGTFENLFPTNHLFYGYLDLAAWKNIQNPYARLAVAPTATTTVALTGHALMRLDEADTFYRASGQPLRDRAVAATTSERYVGTEGDLLVTWRARAGVSILAGVSYLVAGSFLDATDPAGDAPNPFFGYLQLTGGF